MNKQIIEIGFSPCPNDTYIFDALVNSKIDTGNLKFEPVLEDVEALNQRALQNDLMVTKISFGVFPAVLKNYKLLNSGSALGRGAGPLLISNKLIRPDEIDELAIAIPGEHTTAHLLFNLAYPAAHNKIFLRYDEIEGFVSDGKGIGVIIHENRFTYADRGLIKLADLSDSWEQKTGLPVPLGGIVIKRTAQPQIQQQVQYLIRKSLEFAHQHNSILPDFVTANAQEMREAVMRKHIDLYVNEFSLDLGPVGRAAVEKLITVYKGSHPGLQHINSEIFVS